MLNRGTRYGNVRCGIVVDSAEIDEYGDKKELVYIILRWKGGWYKADGEFQSNGIFSIT